MLNIRNVPVIITKGSEWLSYGTDDSKGTKVFALGKLTMLSCCPMVPHLEK